MKPAKHQDTNAANRLMYVLRLVHIIVFVIYIASLGSLFLLRFAENNPEYIGDGTAFNFFVTQLYSPLSAFIALLVAYFFPLYICNLQKPKAPDKILFRLLMLRAIVLIILPIYTLSVGLPHTNKYILLSTLVIAIIVAIITFPTEKRWTKWQNLDTYKY